MEIDSTKPPTVRLPDECDKAFDAYLRYAELRFNTKGDRPTPARFFRAGWLAAKANKVETKEEESNG